MRPFANLVNERFERLLVVKRSETDLTKWECLCDCGKTILARTDSLRSRNTRSCGCLRRESSNQNGLDRKTHGMSHTVEYHAWFDIIGRCFNENYANYKYYGVRGITVCDEWKDSFEAFYRDMGPRPGDGYSIDRRENDKGYCKDNCRWATEIEQKNNTSRNVFYIYNGVAKTLPAWCRELGLKLGTIRSRIENGLSFEEAIKPRK